MTDLACPEPRCDGQLVLRQSKHGHFFGCTHFPKCRGSHGAHPDGRPMGTPAPAAVRHARVKAHEAFDPIWKSGRMSRGRAYRWLAERLGRSEVHIGSADLPLCRRIISICELHRHRPRTRARRDREEQEEPRRIVGHSWGALLATVEEDDAFGHDFYLRDEDGGIPGDR